MTYNQDAEYWRKIAAHRLGLLDVTRAENARLREGIEALAETGEADGRGNSRDLARYLRALLNPPTEGETDHE